MRDESFDAATPPTVMRIAKLEEGEGKGDAWAVLRAGMYLVIGILVLGFLIA